MAMQPGDLNSLQVELDLARQPPAPMVAQPPGYGPELSEAVAEGAGGGGGVAGPPVAETSYPGIHEGSVLLAPPGFTVCESFFDSGVFTCFNPEVVFGAEVRILPNGSFSMGDDVWCNVTIEDGNIKKAELAAAADGGATVSVHVADIRPDGVKQYHVGAVIVAKSSAEPDDISVEVRDLCEAGEGDDEPPKDVLALKGWHGRSPDGCSGPSPVVGSKFLEMAVLGTTGPSCHVPSRDKSDGSMAYQDVEHGLTGVTETLAQMLGPTGDDGEYVDGDEYEVIVAHDNRLRRAKVGNLAEPRVDDCSIEIKELDGKRKLQVKGWDTQTPSAGTTLAAILTGKATAPGPLFVRGPCAQYLPIGSLPTLPTAGTYTFVTDVQYEVSSRQLQKKTRTLTVTANSMSLGEESGWTPITGGQAVPHSGEV